RRRQPREGFRQQCVAGEDAERFAVDDVRRFPPASQIIVVERGKVVVDERVGVNQLERGDRFQERRRVGADRFGGREGENRTHTLAAAEDRVAHGLMNDRGGRGGRRKVFVQRVVDEGAAG